MEFYDVVEKRRTIRDFTEEPIDGEALRRILSAGLRAPSNDHLRQWEFVVLTDRDLIARILRKIPKKVSEKRIDYILKFWHLNDSCQQKMYRDAIPKQYDMLIRSGCLILPLFKQKGDLLAPKSVFSLNAFASIWCCIENILLAAAAEELACALRIPEGDEAAFAAETLGLPKEYVLPCFLAVGHPSDRAVQNEQKEILLASKLHYNAW